MYFSVLTYTPANRLLFHKKSLNIKMMESYLSQTQSAQQNVRDIKDRDTNLVTSHRNLTLPRNIQSDTSWTQRWIKYFHLTRMCMWWTLKCEHWSPWCRVLAWVHVMLIELKNYIVGLIYLNGGPLTASSLSFSVSCFCTGLIMYCILFHLQVYLH